MSARRPPRRTPEQPGAHGLLDWGDSSHWSYTEAPCRYCHEPTHLREIPSRPAHKTCAEAAYARRAAEAADSYRRETL